MANGKYGFDFLVIVERLLVGSLDGAVGEGGGGRVHRVHHHHVPTVRCAWTKK